jgi:NADH-quinone oxidoreductase subunit M
MATWPVLSVTTFLPLVGVLFIAMLRADESGARNARWMALSTTLVTFIVSLNLVWRFDPGSPEFQFVEKHPWLAGFGTYHMGVDGISLPLSSSSPRSCRSASRRAGAPSRSASANTIAFLVLETLMVGTFSALDLVLFYLFEGGSSRCSYHRRLGRPAPGL